MWPITDDKETLKEYLHMSAMLPTDVGNGKLDPGENELGSKNRDQGRAGEAR
jgi:hypothetical protein